MNVLNLDTFKKNIPNSILVSAQKLAKSNAVRELEANIAGHYTAFVDDKQQSFDFAGLRARGSSHRPSTEYS